MAPRVVITGMGVVSPNGIGKEAFCLAVLAGKSGVKRISRFDPSSLPVHIAGEIPEFDELAWVDARERKHVSRVVPLAVAASTEAIKDAGLDPAAMSMEEKREIGVILGTGGGAQEFSEEQYRLWHSGHVKQVSLFCIPSGTMGTIPSEISMRFGFRGYSHVVTAGCTSSTDAIGYAYQHIQAGVLPMFLVGGVDSPITPGIIKGYSLLRALTQSWNHAPESASRPFSADRDGFVMAEGSWMFILEDYEHARARGAHIYAEIAGYGSTCEAFHRVRMSESPEEPARAITLALEEARLHAGRHSVRESSWHFHRNERSRGNPRAEAGSRRACKKDSHVRSEIADRTCPGSLRLGQPGRNADRHGARQDSAHHQSRTPGSGMRSGLRPRCWPQGPDRARDLQLRRIWIEELGAGAEERPRRGRCPHLPGGAKLRSSGTPNRSPNLWRASLARPDEDIWAYVVRD